jgi:GntR family transcriptional regulator
MTALVIYRQVMIDPDGPVPLYRQLADMLREQIESGELPPDRPIPSVARLQQEHGLARGTVLHAVRTLVADGLCYVVPGKGIYVKPADG